MSNFEKKAVCFLEKNKYCFFVFFVFLIGLYIRYINFNYESDDFVGKLLPWYYQLGKNAGGFSSLGSQVGDYNVFYQFLICILTYIPIKPLYAYKLLSVLFDILLSVEAAKIVYFETSNKLKTYIAFAVVYLWPTVIMNSAVWGQCDSIFSYFALLTIRKFMEGKYVPAFISLGFSFANKLQAIFIVPFLLIYYFTEKKYSVIHFVIAFITFYATSIPCFIYGRSLLSPIGEYAYQVGQYERMTLNIINMWTLCSGDYNALSYVAITITILIFGIALLYYLETKKDLSNIYLEIATWSAWTCVLFLPSMHERYPYLAEILLLILCIKNTKYIQITVIQMICSFQTYCYYLFNTEVQQSFILAILLIMSWLLFTYWININPKHQKTK